ncbi:hypothetical protein EZ315_07565 [Duncaniella freteri]|uniref:Uncharacterized protein n=1 Tax=Duncaniella freteri TaxID=2530391 RepID=A0A4Z0VC51_9BACT|nr:hypothetical protein EZ315_07565 [Duncaniella freteri]
MVGVSPVPGAVVLIFFTLVAEAGLEPAIFVE